MYWYYSVYNGVIICLSILQTLNMLIVLLIAITSRWCICEQEIYPPKAVDFADMMNGISMESLFQMEKAILKVTVVIIIMERLPVVTGPTFISCNFFPSPAGRHIQQCLCEHKMLTKTLLPVALR